MPLTSCIPSPAELSQIVQVCRASCSQGDAFLESRASLALCALQVLKTRSISFPLDASSCQCSDTPWNKGTHPSSVELWPRWIYVDAWREARGFAFGSGTVLCLRMVFFSAAASLSCVRHVLVRQALQAADSRT